jgi:hypothetical protein
MTCPKCGFSVTNGYQSCIARKKDSTNIYIKLGFIKCNRKNCDYSYREKYDEKVKSFKSLGLLHI